MRNKRVHDAQGPIIAGGRVARFEEEGRNKSFQDNDESFFFFLNDTTEGVKKR